MIARNSPRPPLVVAALAVVTAVVLLGIPTLLGTVGRVVFGVLLLLVFPGYAALSLLFGTSDGEFAETDRSRIAIGNWNVPVTLALAVGFSVILVPILIRIVMALVGYSRSNVVLLVTGFVVLLGAIDAFASRNASGPDQYQVKITRRPALERVRTYFDRDTTLGLVTSVLLVVSVAFFLSSVGYALSGTPSDHSSTRFYLLTHNESGDLVASGYPTTLANIQQTGLVAGIENDEHETVTYTVVVEVQRLADQSVVEETEVLRTRRTVADGQTATIRHPVETRMRGSNMRVQFYLYRGEAPSDADVESAYRSVYLSVGTSE